MDKLLRPKNLAVDPNAANAEKIFKFWLRTFEDLIETLVETQPEKLEQILTKDVRLSVVYPRLSISTLKRLKLINE